MLLSFRLDQTNYYISIFTSLIYLSIIHNLIIEEFLCENIQFSWQIRMPSIAKFISFIMYRKLSNYLAIIVISRCYFQVLV